MTKEQAIKFANCLKNNYTIDFNDMTDFCDMVIKALERSTIDKAMVDTLIEENEKLKADNKILAENYLKDLINCHSSVIKEQQSSDDCVSRADARHLIAKSFRKNLLGMTFNKMFETLYKGIDELSPVTPTHGTCKECKYSSVHTISLDKIDEIRVCRIQFSKQIKDDYYCANYEKRGNEE